MSENKPEPRDRTPLYIAIVGALATIAAALIGVLPNMLNRGAPPPSPIAIVITATPVPTQIPIETNVPTTVPPTNVPPTNVPPSGAATAATAPLTITVEAMLPAPTVPQAVTATAPATAIPSNIITFLLVNNLPQKMEFFVDNEGQTRINSGDYEILHLLRGMHQLKQCVVGTDYTDPNNCFDRAYDLESEPDVWVMFSDSNPLLTQENVSLLVLNRAPIPQDIFIDGQLADTVPPHDFKPIFVIPGEHTIQPCAPGIHPPSGGCGKAFKNRYTAPTHFFIINGESS